MITNYDELNVGQYLELLAVEKTEGLEDIDKQVKMVSILSGLSEDELLHMEIGKYTMLARAADFLSEAPEDAAIKDKYEAGGMTLVPCKDFRKLETGQYIDFKAYATDIEKYFVEFISVLLIPEGHRYGEGYDIAEVQAAVKAMPVPEAMGVIAFFFASYRNLMLDSLNYSETEAKKLADPKERERMMKQIAEARAALQASGDGSNA